MPARKPAPTDAPTTFVLTDKGRLLACDGGLPAGAVFWCREGDPEWTRAADVPPPAAPAKASRRAGLFDDPKGED